MDQFQTLFKKVQDCTDGKSRVDCLSEIFTKMEEHKMDVKLCDLVNNEVMNILYKILSTDYIRDNNHTVFSKNLRLLAKSGNSYAQNYYGTLYHIDGIEWFIKSAAQNNSFGQANLGRNYMILGHMRCRDSYTSVRNKRYKNAESWLVKSAEQLNLDGLRNLIIFYQGCCIDHEKEQKYTTLYSQYKN